MTQSSLLISLAERCDEKCPNCNDANEYGDYEGPTCEVCGGIGKITAVNTCPAISELVEALEEVLREHGGFTIKGECERKARAALSHYRELAGTSNEVAKS